MITLSSKNVKSLDEINKFIMKEYGFDESYVVTNRDLDENISVFSLHIGPETAVKTYFKKCIQRFPEELQNATVFAPTLKEAIKDKCKNIEINTNFDIVMQNDKDKKYIVGHKLDSSKINKSIEDTLLLIYDYFDPSSDMEASISCGKEVITRLMNYEVVTLRPENSEDICLIATCKLFTNIKKCNSFAVAWFPSDEDLITNTMISATYFDDNVLGISVFKCLKC